MNKVKDYVDFRLTHSDKLADADGYPLELSDCKKHKPMRDLKIYGNSFQDGTPTPDAPVDVQSVGELVTDEADVNYGKYKIPVVQRGINIADMSVIAKHACVDNGDGTYTLTKGISRQTGNIYPNIQADSVIRVSCSFEHVNTSVEHLPMQIVYANGSQITLKLYNNKIVSTTAAAQVDYIRIIMSNSDDDGAYYKFKDLMITVDAEYESYEPYTKPITTNIFLNEPLRKLGDYADYIDFKGNKVVRNIVSRDNNYVQRTNIMAYSSPSYDVVNCYRTVLGVLATNNRTLKLVCSNMLVDGEYVANKAPTSIGYSEEGFLYFRFDDENNYGVTDVTTFRKWLSQNNLIVYYVNHTPIEEPLNMEHPKLKAKTSIIEIDTSLLPSAVYGKYIKK